VELWYRASLCRRVLGSRGIAHKHPERSLQVRLLLPGLDLPMLHHEW
jgi:hypothetical protein